MAGKEGRKIYRSARWRIIRESVLSTPVEKVTNVAGENVTLGGGDEPLVRRLLLCSCSLSLRG